MKNSFFLFLLFSYTAFSQQLHFKVTYKPEKTYRQTIEQASNMEISYSASKKILKEMEAQGLKNPTVSNSNSSTDAIFKTGKLTDGVHFPVTIEFVSSTSTEAKQGIPDGTKIYGQGAIGIMPTLDSIYSPAMDPDFQNQFLKGMQAMMSQITFPEKDLQIGESFDRKTTLAIPLSEGMKFDMIINTTYKLISIQDGKANFNVSQQYTMKSAVNEYNVKATGSGKGQLLYDIAENFYLRYEVSSTIEMNVKIEEMKLQLTMKNGFRQTTVIENN